MPKVPQITNDPTSSSRPALIFCPKMRKKAFLSHRLGIARSASLPRAGAAAIVTSVAAIQAKGLASRLGAGNGSAIEESILTDLESRPRGAQRRPLSARLPSRAGAIGREGGKAELHPCENSCRETSKLTNS